MFTEVPQSITPLQRSQTLRRLLPEVASRGRFLTDRSLLTFIQDISPLPADFSTQFFVDTKYAKYFDTGNSSAVLQTTRGLGLLILFVELTHRLAVAILQSECILDIIDKAFEEKKKNPSLSIFEVYNILQRYPGVPTTLTIPSFSSVLDDETLKKLSPEQFHTFVDSYASYIEEQRKLDNYAIVRVHEDIYFNRLKKNGGSCFIALLSTKKNDQGVWLAEVFEGYNGVVTVTLESIVKSLAVFVGGRHVGTGIVARK